MGIGVPGRDVCQSRVGFDSEGTIGPERAADITRDIGIAGKGSHGFETYSAECGQFVSAGV